MSLNRITRRQVMEGLAGVGAYSLLSGCSLIPPDTATQTTASTTSQPVPSGPLTTANLTVTATSAGTIPANFAALSYDKTEMVHPFFSVTNTNLLALFKLIGPSLLRIGGDASDKFTWTPNGKGQTYAQLTQTDVQSFVAFVKASGWKVLYTVNLGGSAFPVGTTGYTTPALAAAEVAYVSAQLGTALYGIEIGNEPDNYGEAGSYYAGNWSLAQYEALWNTYRTAILATTPGVFITGPAGGHLATWTIPFTQDQTINKVGLLTDHYYKISGTSSNITIAKLLAYPDPTLVSNLQLMKASQAITGIPFRLGETNSVTGGYPGVSDSYASSLWLLDHMYTCALGGAVGLQVIGGQGANYSPIGDDEINVTGIAPEFYAMVLFILAGQGTLYTTSLSVGSVNASAYAIRTTAGLSLVLVNKDATQNLNLTATLPMAVNYANLFVLTQKTGVATVADLTATSGVTIQGSSIGINGSFTPGAAYKPGSSGTQLTCYVPAASAVMIQVF